MRDFFKEYKSQKLKRNVVIISFSLVFALGINFFIFGTDVGTKLQTSIKNYNDTKPITKDIYLQDGVLGADLLSLKMGTGLQKVSEIWVSLLFDSEKLKLSDFFSDNSNIEIIKNSNVPGIFLLNIKFKAPVDLSSDSEVIKISYAKLKQEKSVINLAETTFISENKTYELTNESLEF